MATNPPATDARVISATSERLFETVEALFGRPLTEAERLSFTTRLAGINTSAVAPGDLITADLFNALRADLNDLALRLALVEDGFSNTASPPIITRIEPAGLRSGEEMTVFGRNLTPQRLTLITVGGVDVPIGRIVSGGDTVLVFPSPAIPGLSATGAQVPVRIANGAGEAMQSFFIRGATTDALVAGFAFGSPGLRLAGGGALPGQVAANTDYDLVYSVKASSTRAETFTVSTTISPTSGGWSATVVSGDEAMAVPQTVTSVDRTVRVRVRTGASGTANVRLRVRGTTDANAGGESTDTPITVAATGPVAVTEIVFSPLVKAAGSAPIAVSGSTVYFGDASGAATERVVRCEVTVNAPTGAAGTTLYQIGEPVISGGAGWEARLDMPAGDRSLTAPAGGAAQGTIRVGLRFTGTFNSALPTAFDRIVTVPVTGPGGSPSRSLAFSLRRRIDHTTPTPA
jgi:hypothetical protein